MAVISRDAQSTGNNSGQTSLTIAHTVGASTTWRMILVAIRDDTNTVTGVTYAGVAMTQLKTATAFSRTLFIYGLLAPTTGNNNIVISRSSSTGSLYGIGASYNNVLSSGLPDSTVADTDSDTAVDVIFTTVADNCWSFICSSNNGSGAISASTGSSRLTADTTGIFDTFDSNGAITPAGSYTMNLTQGGSFNIGTIGVSFAPQATVTQNITDTLSIGEALPFSITVPVTDTLGLTDAVTSANGYSSQTKNSVTWTPQSKS